MPHDFQAALVAKKTTALDTLYLTFRAVDLDEAPFHAGQFVFLVLNPKEVRAYSLASAPSAWPEFSLLVKIVPEGKAGQFFTAAEAGDTVDFRGPMGRFELHAEEAPKYFMATGTGLAPFLSFLREAYPVDGEPSTRQHFVSVGIWNTHYAPELDQLRAIRERSNGTFEFELALSDPQPDDPQLPEARQGWCTDGLSRLTDEQLKTYEFGLCGNPHMVKAAREKLLELGVPREHVDFEQWT